jgi:hypothetical protein
MTSKTLQLARYAPMLAETEVQFWKALKAPDVQSHWGDSATRVSFGTSWHP